MNDVAQGHRAEIKRIARISDLLCSGHASLRDRYARRAFFLDLAILGLSTWLVALAFVEPRIHLSLTPRGWDPQLWIGILGTGVFFLSLIQMKTDWKGRSDAHKRTQSIYGEVKRDARYLIASESLDDADRRHLLARYEMASAIGIEMPEKEFLRQKRRHLIKVAVSRHLDDHPAASVTLTSVRLWLRDNGHNTSHHAAQTD